MYEQIKPGMQERYINLFLVVLPDGHEETRAKNTHDLYYISL